jgi:hypothetical protein
MTFKKFVLLKSHEKYLKATSESTTPLTKLSTTRHDIFAAVHDENTTDVLLMWLCFLWHLHRTGQRGTLGVKRMAWPKLTRRKSADGSVFLPVAGAQTVKGKCTRRGWPYRLAIQILAAVGRWVLLSVRDFLWFSLVFSPFWLLLVSFTPSTLVCHQCPPFRHHRRRLVTSFRCIFSGVKFDGVLFNATRVFWPSPVWINQLNK